MISFGLYGGRYRRAADAYIEVGSLTSDDPSIPMLPLLSGENLVLTASANIAAAAATATTSQLTGGTGSFTAGKISDDTNPLPSIDITADGYTELEWAFSGVTGLAANGDVYEFRVVRGGQPLDAYTVTPLYTVGDPAPTLTDVDTDETILDGQTGVAATFTAGGTTNGDRSFTLRQGSVSCTQTETGTGTSTSATLTIAVDQSGADIKFGSATMRITRGSDSLYGELAVTVNPPTGQLYVNVGTPNTTSADRITAVADIASGDQIQARGVGGGAAPTGLTLNTDATFYFTSGNPPADFDVRVWDAGDSTWGAWATQSGMSAAGQPTIRRFDQVPHMGGRRRFGAAFG